jgi:hypothetical protein
MLAKVMKKKKVKNVFFGFSTLPTIRGKCERAMETL